MLAQIAKTMKANLKQTDVAALRQVMELMQSCVSQGRGAGRRELVKACLLLGEERSIAGYRVEQKERHLRIYTQSYPLDPIESITLVLGPRESPYMEVREHRCSGEVRTTESLSYGQTRAWCMDLMRAYIAAPM